MAGPNGGTGERIDGDQCRSRTAGSLIYRSNERAGSRALVREARTRGMDASDGGKARTMDDPELKRIVEDELAWAPHLDASAVRVDVREGIVLLSGFVSSLAEKRRVERAVWHLRGVRGIAQDIEVMIPVARRRTDEEIAHSAVHVLRWDAEVPDERIQVKVEHGVVTLIGAVDRQFEKEEAEERVHKLAGVRAIDNRIVVRPEKAEKDIAGAVERALLRNARLHGAGIVVGAEGSKVTLSGLVASIEDREAAADLAWRTAGVGKVENDLVVRC